MSGSTLITKLETHVVFALKTEDFERAAFFLRYAGFSVTPCTHPSRYVVEDTAVPYEVPPQPKRTSFPLALDIRTEDIIGVIQALNVGDFKVMGSLEHEGRYEVHDVQSLSPHVEPGSAA